MFRLMIAGLAAVLASALALAQAPATAPSEPPCKSVYAVAQTDPVADEGDAADDPAIWVCKDHPDRSLILGTNKKEGLNVYDLQGRLCSTASPGAHPNNVDVVYGFSIAGRERDLAVAGCRAASSRGMKFWAIDGERQTLTDVTAGGVIPVVDGQDPYGSCVYRSPRTGGHYFFINDKTGRVEQYEMLDAGGGLVGARRVRSFKLSSQVEGCVADDELGVVYIAEEDVGIWKFGAEPDDPATGTLVARVGEHGLAADVEGLALYTAPEGRGYLLASSQGNSSYVVYRRDGNNEFVQRFVIADGTIDGVSETDGIAVCGSYLGDRFPRGLFVAQDAHVPGGRQNFKLVAWEQIAGDKLLIAAPPPTGNLAR